MCSNLMDLSWMLPRSTDTERHVTIQNGGPIQLAKCVQCCSKYHCPFCKPEIFKPTVESKVRKHIKAHEKRAVKFEGYVIFKCGLNCRTVSHFHCPKCCKLLEKKNRFVDHLHKCVGTVTAEGGGHHLPVKQEADRHHVPEDEENNPVPKAKDQDCRLEAGPNPALPLQSEVVSVPQPNHSLASTNLHDSRSPCTFVNPRTNRKGRSQKMSFVEGNTPTPLSTCSTVEEKSWREAVKSLQTYQETSIFKSREVIVNTQCLLELFQFCWHCQKECCITIEGNERLFSVTQDCQSCGHHRDWRSHPPSAEPEQTFHNEEEHTLEDEDGEEVVVQIVSSDNECSEQVFIEKDGSYLSSDDEEASLQEEEVKKKRKRKSKSKDSSDEWEPGLDEEATDSDVSMDEDLFTALKEDGQGNLVVWCTQCGTEASLSCSVLRHKKVFCCARCGAGDDIQTRNIESLPVRFDDVAGFQKHAEQEHGAKPFYTLCQDCGKFVTADPESRGLKQHKCEHKSKFIVCPECGKRFLTEGGLKTHYTQLHSDYDHPCKYCLKVFKTKSAKLEHEQTHPKESQPYRCPDCPEKFSSIYKRNNHVVSHRAPRKYVCEKGFKDIMRLKGHEVIHSGEQPFKCQVCERSFNQILNLTSHMRVHTGEKPFTCEQCGESFSHSVSLKNHKQRHHDSSLTQEKDVIYTNTRETAPWSP